MTSEAGRTSDEDLFVLLILGVLGFGAAGTFAVAGWSKTVGWLLAHQLLVTGSAHPLLVVPQAAGAGLDVPRLALLAAAVLLLIVGAVGVVRRRLQHGALR